jgi:hypothetical protein
MNIRKLQLALTLALCSAASLLHATVFNYSYSFGDGLTVSGSLTGSQNGAFVENVANVTLFFNGTEAPGTIYTSKFDSANYVSGPVVSFDALQNNFVFSNSDLAGGDFGYDSLFYILNQSVSDDTAVAFSGVLGFFGSQDLPTVSQSWSLVEVGATPVPDGGVTIGLLGAAMALLAVTHPRIGQMVRSQRMA